MTIDMRALFSTLRWTREPRPDAALHTFVVRFVPSDFEPPTWLGGYAFVEDADVVKQVRRQLRREARELVKVYGSMPRAFRQQPFWWTPRNTQLLVGEVLDIAGVVAFPTPPRPTAALNIHPVTT